MTPRTSVRAATRDIYSTMPGRELALGLAPEMGQGAVRKVDVAMPRDQRPQDTPLPDPPPQGGREHAEQGERGQSEFGEGTAQESAPTPDPSSLLADARGGGEKKEPSLMARVRALYEDTAVPVREIARLAGVTERTLYKYVAKGRWRRRYILKPRGKAAAAGNRGRRWKRAAGQEGVKGAGGRFIARAEADKKVVRGLKALDPRKRAQASEACAAASAHHDAARVQAEYSQALDAKCKALNFLNRRLADYERFLDQQAKARSAAERHALALMAEHYVRQIDWAIEDLERLRPVKDRRTTPTPRR